MSDEEHQSGSEEPQGEETKENESNGDESAGEKGEKQENEGEKQENEGCMIHVGQLKWEITEDELKDAFSKFGEIKNVKIPIDKQHRSRGFGFVEFATKEAADEAIKEMDNFDLKGRNIRVTLSEHKNIDFRRDPPRDRRRDDRRYDRRGGDRRRGRYDDDDRRSRGDRRGRRDHRYDRDDRYDRY